MTNKNIVGVVLFLLIFAIGYIAYDKYTDYRLDKDQQIALEAYRYGNQQTIISIFEVATKCEQIPLEYQDQKINLISIECLQQAAQNG